MTSAEKISFMHRLFGDAENGEKCKDCNHFHRYQAGNRLVRKCEVYGLSHSEATDWNAGFTACGIFGKETDRRNVYKSANTYSFEEAVINGQVTIWER